jgi:hypothetical protein
MFVREAKPAQAPQKFRSMFVRKAKPAQALQKFRSVSVRQTKPALQLKKSRSVLVRKAKPAHALQKSRSMFVREAKPAQAYGSHGPLCMRVLLRSDFCVGIYSSVLQLKCIECVHVPINFQRELHCLENEISVTKVL